MKRVLLLLRGGQQTTQHRRHTPGLALQHAECGLNGGGVAQAGPGGEFLGAGRHIGHAPGGKRARANIAVTDDLDALVEETLQKPLEQPIFFEEFSRDDADPRNITSNSAYILPEKLVKMIGDEAVAENLRIWKSANLYNLTLFYTI